MSKRFTDTEKWSKTWFSDLSIENKLVWIYLLDNCDHCGVWSINLKLMKFQIGLSSKFTLNDLENDFYGKIMVINNKLLVIDFFDFQYGKTSHQFKAKQSALERLKMLGFYDENYSLIKDSPKSYLRLGEELVNSYSNSNSNSNSISILEESEKPFKISDQKLLEVYEIYPRKIGRSKGLEKLKKIAKSDLELKEVKDAIKNYVAYLDRSGTESRFIKHFDSFLTVFKDWLDPNHGDSMNFGKNDEKMDYSFLKDFK